MIGGMAVLILSVRCLETGIALSSMEQTSIGTPSCVWIGLRTDKLFLEFRNQGVPVIQEPENKPWAYEMKIQDPDGNILLLGTAPKQGSQ